MKTMTAYPAMPKMTAGKGTTATFDRPYLAPVVRRLKPILEASTRERPPPWTGDTSRGYLTP